MTTPARELAGSSPRTRGTPPSDRMPPRSCRIIPAHAGNTGAAALKIWRRADHPRARGEHVDAALGGVRVIGSSPRTRGTQAACAASRAAPRIIPAHAGNTRCARCACPRSADHPRARGEHLPHPAWLHTRAGSSPRTRGTPRKRVPVAAPGRIIPAHAGNTAMGRRMAGSSPDHPRARGEHTNASHLACSTCGSSPRTRGTRSRHAGAHPAIRIIPAHAGNTPGAAQPERIQPDHPRARGEHFLASPALRTGGGSSPRTRGTLSTGAAGCARYRIIPAHAGNTVRWAASTTTKTDHPRARGEHPRAWSTLRPRSGSSPRTRGTLQLLRGVLPPRRIIPAHAGNTLVILLILH